MKNTLKVKLVPRRNTKTDKFVDKIFTILLTITLFLVATFTVSNYIYCLRKYDFQGELPRWGWSLYFLSLDVLVRLLIYYYITI